MNLITKKSFKDMQDNHRATYMRTLEEIVEKNDARIIELFVKTFNEVAKDRAININENQFGIEICNNIILKAMDELDEFKLTGDMRYDIVEHYEKIFIKLIEKAGYKATQGRYLNKWLDTKLENGYHKSKVIFTSTISVKVE